MQNDRGRSGVLGHAAPAAVFLIVLVLSAALDSAAAAAGTGERAAQIENARPESELTIVRLTPRAVERLGVRTAAVDQSVRARTRTVGGRVMTPPGHTILVAAPNAGTVLTVPERGLPYPGTPVRRGDDLLRLLVVSPGELLRAREIAEVATARVAIAEQAASLEPSSSDAATELAAAEALLVPALARLRLLSGGGGPGADGLTPVTVEAPVSGVVRSLSVSAGQAVPGGSALLEIIRTDPVWVRTPLYAGDTSSVRSGAPALVRRLSEPASEARPASPVTGPPSADFDAASVDLFFVADNPGGELRAGERVLVTLMLGDDLPSLSVPFSAVIYDIQGGSWVYEQLDETAFVRRRVEIAYVQDGTAVLARGPARGTRVVTHGVAEIFGAEFGVGH